MVNAKNRTISCKVTEATFKRLERIADILKADIKLKTGMSYLISSIITSFVYEVIPNMERELKFWDIRIEDYYKARNTISFGRYFEPLKFNIAPMLPKDEMIDASMVKSNDPIMKNKEKEFDRLSSIKFKGETKDG